MVGSDPKKNDPIVRIDTVHGAPTGEGTVYVTRSGRRWRSVLGGSVVSGGDDGELVGDSKWGPTGVRVRT